MNDPHIDIDEIENEVPPASSKTNPQEKTHHGGSAKSFEDEEDEHWPVNYSFGDIFAGMNRQFRRFQEQFGPGIGRPGDFELIPSDTRRHLRASQREFLLAW